MKTKSNWNTKEITIWNPKTARNEFDLINDWVEFLTKWRKVRYLADAIAMMHELERMYFSLKINTPINGVISFLLFYAKEAKNESLRQTALQVLFGKILPDIFDDTRVGSNLGIMHDQDEFRELLSEILDFLGEIQECLRSRPLAGRVLRFLVTTNTLHRRSINYEWNIFASEHLEAITRAIIAWHGGFYYVAPSASAERARVKLLLENYLNSCNVRANIYKALLPEIPAGNIDDLIIPYKDPANPDRRHRIETASAYYIYLSNFGK